MTRIALLALTLVFATAAIGCDSGAPTTTRCTSSSDCHGGAICIDGHCMSAHDGGQNAMDGSTGPRPDDVLTVRVDPATATLDSVDGAAVMQAFTLIGVQRNGMERALTGASWNLDTIRVGTIDGVGLFSADGTAGGTSTVTASVMVPGGPAMGTATVTVNVHRTILGAGVPTDVGDHFAGSGVTDPTAITVLYPLEGATMPANVFPPTIQWAPVGAVGDFFRVTVQRPHATIVAYLTNADASFGHGWPADLAAWHVIANSDPDTDVSITVDRFETATSRLITGAGARAMHLARGNLFGSVYYEHRQGNASILRIHAETAVRETLVPNPPPAPDGSRCIGCHAVTHDGRYIFGDTTFVDGVYDLTTDLTGDPPAPRFAPFATAGMYVASFDPDGHYFVAGSHVSGPLGIFDATTGVPATATGLPAATSGYPSWSPDGMHIAYAGNVVTAPTGHPEAGDPIGGSIMVLDRTSATGLDFMAPRTLHDGASLVGLPEGGTCDTHPTWSPDGNMIAFQHGVGTFTHVVRNPGALYMLGMDGSLYRLDHANGTTNADGYWPTFAPYVTTEAGGRSYYWMAFYTRRDYGNPILGTQGTQVRQLWVAAVDTHPTAGVDPSLVPYWLPGQDIRTSNFSAFWAPEACRATAAGCSTSSECCSGRCAPDATGMSTCVAPPECHHEGETCGGDGDCCAPLTCHGNVCGSHGPD